MDMHGTDTSNTNLLTPARCHQWDPVLSRQNEIKGITLIGITDIVSIAINTQSRFSS